MLPLLTASINGLDSSLVNGTFTAMPLKSNRPANALCETGLQILPAWKTYFHDPSGKTLGAEPALTRCRSPRLNSPCIGLISAAQVIGSIVVSLHASVPTLTTHDHMFVLQGLPFTPYSSDNLGRRPTLLIGAMVMLAGVAMQSAATSIGMFIGARGLSTS